MPILFNEFTNADDICSDWPVNGVINEEDTGRKNEVKNSIKKKKAMTYRMISIMYELYKKACFEYFRLSIFFGFSSRQTNLMPRT